MTQWPNILFTYLAICALIWWMLEVVAEKARAVPLAPHPEPEVDGLMNDPEWLEIHDAAEEFLRTGDRLDRYRLERALDAVLC